MQENTKLKRVKQEKNLSVCEVMKDDTSEVFRKMESHIPLMFQNYSNLYARYLHMLDDVFGTCYIAEKEFFDRLNIDQGILKQVKKNSESIKNTCIENIEMSSKFFDQYLHMRIDAITSFDNCAHVMMDSYANFLSQCNKSS